MHGTGCSQQPVETCCDNKRSTKTAPMYTHNVIVVVFLMCTRTSVACKAVESLQTFTLPGAVVALAHIRAFRRLMGDILCHSKVYPRIP